jgi:hypothetical protein
MVRSLGCSFFKSWNHEMAYILGDWFADGNIYTQKSGAQVAHADLTVCAGSIFGGVRARIYRWGWKPEVFDPSLITPKMWELFGQYLL